MESLCSSMKTVYFVRHGESENNASARYNAFDTRLSQKGEQQAAEIAERCAKLPIQAIIASDMLRAQQTAGIIAQRIGIEIQTSDLFREKITSTRILGKKHDDPEAIKIVKESDENFHVPTWRNSDGENFEDLKQRALKGFDYLANRKEDSILVVTHGFFLYFIAAVALFGTELTSHECSHIMHGLGDSKNSSLAIIKQRKIERVGDRSSWEISVWNDHSHLG